MTACAVAEDILYMVMFNSARLRCLLIGTVLRIEPHDNILARVGNLVLQDVWSRDVER
jgi:hypothetical protein